MLIHVDLKKFDVLQALKTGAFVSVSSVKNQETGSIYADKVLITYEKENKKMINHEIGNMIRSKHPIVFKFSHIVGKKNSRSIFPFY